MRVSTDLQNAFGKYLSLVEKEDSLLPKRQERRQTVRFNEHDYYLVPEESLKYKSTRISYEEYMALVNLATSGMNKRREFPWPHPASSNCGKRNAGTFTYFRKALRH